VKRIDTLDYERRERRSAEADGYGLEARRREPVGWELTYLNRWAPELGEWVGDPPIGVW